MRTSISIVAVTLFGLIVGACDGGDSGDERAPTAAGIEASRDARPCAIRPGQGPIRNCFIIELEDPTYGDPPSQPAEVRGPLSLGGEPVAAELPDLPDYVGEPQTITVWPDLSPEDPDNPHPPTHTHDGGASGSGHCHYWYRLSSSSYIQVHC